ncbi:MAG: hypothetical protein WCK83_03975 [Burkholderiales bacterium]
MIDLSAVQQAGSGIAYRNVLPFVIARPPTFVIARPKAVAIHDFMPAWIATLRSQ